MLGKIQAGSTSITDTVFVRNTSVTTAVQGLTGLAYNTSGMTLYYRRQGASSDVQVTLVTATLGTFTSGGFVKIDDTNMPGQVEIGYPNAALASGAKYVTFHLRGAANMEDIVWKVELDAVNYQSQNGFISGMNGYAAGAASGPATFNTAGNVPSDIQTIKTQSVTCSAAVTVPATISSLTQAQVTGGAYALQTDAGGYMKLSSGTGTGQISLSSGLVTITAANITSIQSGLATSASQTTINSNVSSVGAAVVALGSPMQAGATVNANAIQIDGSTTAAANAASFFSQSTAPAGSVTIASIPTTGDTVTISDATHGATTFEFTNGSPSGSATAVGIGDTTILCNQNLAIAIGDANLSVAVDFADSNVSVLTGTIQGSAGNIAITTTGNPRITVAGMSGGFVGVYVDSVGAVDLSATQPHYAPAIAGAQMDLVNAPNATAITAIQSGLATAANLAALALKLTGITSLGNWLRTAFRKDSPDTTALSEINATTNGIAGTFDPTLHAEQTLATRFNATGTLMGSNWEGSAAFFTNAPSGGGGGGGTTTINIQDAAT